MLPVDGNSKIHEVYRGGGGFTGPLKAMPLLHISCKVKPEFCISNGARVRDSYANDIVDELTIEH